MVNFIVKNYIRSKEISEPSLQKHIIYSFIVIFFSFLHETKTFSTYQLWKFLDQRMKSSTASHCRKCNRVEHNPSIIRFSYQLNYITQLLHTTQDVHQNISHR